MSGTPEVYFDAATAAPLHPAGRSALLAALDDGWADPDKLYQSSRRAAQLLDAARASIAQVLDVRPAELTFCASGSDACHRAVAGLLHGNRRRGAALVHSAVEHSSVLRAAQAYGRSVSVPVSRTGRVELAEFAAAVRASGVAAAALMSANHEVGTLQPVTAAAAECTSAGVPLLVDAAQTLGKAQVPDGWSVLTGSARKWGGPAGVGILAVRPGVRFEPVGPPPGPMSVPLAVAAAAALRATAAQAAQTDERLRPLVERVRREVARLVPGVEVVGEPVDRLANIVTFSCLYVDGEALLSVLNQHGFAVSSGSSCTSDTLHPSHVLTAMGVLSHGNIRVSLHERSTESEVDRFLALLPGIVARLRAEIGVSDL